MMTMNSYPFRKVVRTQDYSHRSCRRGEGSRIFFLECGHEVRAKQSKGFPKRKRCCWC